jgi:hypothetical protein
LVAIARKPINRIMKVFRKLNAAPAAMQVFCQSDSSEVVAQRVELNCHEGVREGCCTIRQNSIIPKPEANHLPLLVSLSPVVSTSLPLPSSVKVCRCVSHTSGPICRRVSTVRETSRVGPFRTAGSGASVSLMVWLPPVAVGVVVTRIRALRSKGFPGSGTSPGL